MRFILFFINFIVKTGSVGTGSRKPYLRMSLLIAIRLLHNNFNIALRIKKLLPKFMSITMI